MEIDSRVIGVQPMPLPHFWAGRKNKAGRQAQPTVLVLHYTAGHDIQGAWNAMNSRGVSAHYTIGVDRVVQHVREEDRSWHAGVSSWCGIAGVNQFSLGVEIVNFGYGFPIGEAKGSPDKTYGVGNWYRDERTTGSNFVRGKTTQEMEKFPDHRPEWAKHWWSKYPSVIQAKVVDLVLDIMRRNPEIFPENVIGHEHVSPGNKQDPGPAFQPVWVALHNAMMAEFGDTYRFDPNENKSVRIKSVQSHLTRLGIRIGAIDGVWGPMSQRGVDKAFDMYGDLYGMESEIPMDTNPTFTQIAAALRLIPGFRTDVL